MPNLLKFFLRKGNQPRMEEDAFEDVTRQCEEYTQDLVRKFNAAYQAYNCNGMYQAMTECMLLAFLQQYDALIKKDSNQTRTVFNSFFVVKQLPSAHSQLAFELRCMNWVKNILEEGEKLGQTNEFNTEVAEEIAFLFKELKNHTRSMLTVEINPLPLILFAPILALFFIFPSFPTAIMAIVATIYCFTVMTLGEYFSSTNEIKTNKIRQMAFKVSDEIYRFKNEAELKVNRSRGFIDTFPGDLYSENAHSFINWAENIDSTTNIPILSPL